MSFHTLFHQNKKTVNSKRKADLQFFLHSNGLKCKDISLIDLALTHRSYANESGDIFFNNERLEFLGDSVLGVVVCEYLYLNFPDQKEGYLSKIKSYIVSEATLSLFAKKLSLPKYLVMGKGELLSGGQEKAAVLADAMEAILGALYLDSGFKVVKEFILSLITPEIKRVLSEGTTNDFKTLLQEVCQKRFHQYPQYKLINKSGPEHDLRYYMSVVVNGNEYGPAVGKTKKMAQQYVAKEAYEDICKKI